MSGDEAMKRSSPFAELGRREGDRGPAANQPTPMTGISQRAPRPTATANTEPDEDDAGTEKDPPNDPARLAVVFLVAHSIRLGSSVAATERAVRRLAEPGQERAWVRCR